jgi:hypothetical protein
MPQRGALTRAAVLIDSSSMLRPLIAFWRESASLNMAPETLDFLDPR